MPWDADAARDRLQQFVIETFGDPEGIGVVDETGFLKKGSGTPARLVSEIIASLPKSAWKRLAVVEGEKGVITYHRACVRVGESRDQLPGPGVWLLARRSKSAPDKLAYYLAYTPPKTALEELVRVASSRYTVDQCIEEAKGETGLDEYEVRFWHSW